MIDYKFNYISRTGTATICRIRFYRGDFETVMEKNIFEVVVPVVRYLRKQLIGTEIHRFDSDKDMEELRLHGKQELLRFSSFGDPIDKQKIV